MHEHERVTERVTERVRDLKQKPRSRPVDPVVLILRKGDKLGHDAWSWIDSTILYLANGRYGVLLVGLRDTATHTDLLNPPSSTMITLNHHLIYMAERPVLPEIQG